MPSTSGPPDEPDARGAVCSMLPPMRLPPGPRNVCSIAEMLPTVTRAAPAPVEASPNTTSPMAASASDQVRAVAPAVSTSITARSPSGSTPPTLPRSLRPSRNVTVTSSPRRLWAFVRTRPSAMTTPLPRLPWPIPTTAGPADSWTLRIAFERSSRMDIVVGFSGIRVLPDHRGGQLSVANRNIQLTRRRRKSRGRMPP